MSALVVTNARLWDGRPLESDALAIVDGRVAAYGTSAEILARFAVGGGANTGARVLDAGGATVTPGLCDAHIHLLPWARAAGEVALLGATGRDDAVARVARFLAANPGDGLVIGRGWDASGWAEPPHRDALDAVSPTRPVMLHSKDFHAIWANGAALERAGLTRASRDPEGGLIERDARGEPTGLLRENAVRPLLALEAAATRAAGGDAAWLEAAARRLHAWGITMVHDFERGADAQRAMRTFARSAAARVRVLQCVGRDDLDRALADGVRSGDGDDAFRIGALKLFADGTLGARTAAMLEPFADRGGLGLETMSPGELREVVGRAVRGGVAVAIHAIGDRACRNALDAFAAAGDALRLPTLASRIEHAQLVDPADLPRFAELRVAASMQPVHCVSDAPAARRAWGARVTNSYPWRSLLESGALLAFGSDAPVESPEPGPAIAAAVGRVGADGAAYTSEQSLGLDATLEAFTHAPARLAGAFPRLGTLRPGSVADIVVWDRDLHGSPAERLHEVVPSCTVLGGRVVYAAGGGGEE